MKDRVTKQTSILITTAAALILGVSHAASAQVLGMEDIETGPDVYLFTDNDDRKKVIDYKNDRIARVCVEASPNPVAMDVTHDGETTTVQPGDCVRLEGKEFFLEPADLLKPGWMLRAEVDTLD